MDRQRRTADLVALILNDAWFVRHYALQRTPTQKIRRDQAVHKLGQTIRDAFTSSDDFEPLLEAILEGLRPTHIQRPF